MLTETITQVRLIRGGYSGGESLSNTAPHLRDALAISPIHKAGALVFVCLFLFIILIYLDALHPNKSR